MGYGIMFGKSKSYSRLVLSDLGYGTGFRDQTFLRTMTQPVTAKVPIWIARYE